jgi:hypothetical protein
VLQGVAPEEVGHFQQQWQQAAASFPQHQAGNWQAQPGLPAAGSQGWSGGWYQNQPGQQQWQQQQWQQQQWQQQGQQQQWHQQGSGGGYM